MSPRAAFPKGNPILCMRDEVGTIYEDEAFAHLFPDARPTRRGPLAAGAGRRSSSSPRTSPTGRRPRPCAARIDWKYALSLELTDPGFDASVLCEFRARLLEGDAGHLLLDVLLRRFRELALLKARGKQRTDSTHVLAAVRALNRLELVRETLRHARDVLTEVAPGWLLVHARGEWVKRYRGRSDAERLPKGKEAQRELADQIGRDGAALLGAISSADAPSWLREVPAVETLRRIWVQHSRQTERGVRFRTTEDGLPPSAPFISSPYDADAHLGKQRTTCWIGDKVSLTETCEDDLPNLITHVETTAAPTADGEVTPKVHEDLQAKDLLPAVHLVDTGFLDAELLVESRRQYQVELLGPTRQDRRWQARAERGLRQPSTSPWTSGGGRPSARRDTRASSGCPASTTAATTAATSGSRRRTAARVPAAPRAPSRGRSTRGGASPSGPNRSTRPCRSGGNSRRARSTRGSTPGEQAWKARSRRASGGAGFDARATSVSPRRTSGTC